MKRAKKGFTLVEVICVLVIIAIIAVIAVPNISGYVERSKKNNCQSVMTNFVNDLEYKIVSKRYYDINELNTELVNVVKSYGEIVGYEDSVPAQGTELTVSGICPNDTGKYTIKWTITEDLSADPANSNQVLSATVRVGMDFSEKNGGVCRCSCMGDDENQVTVKTGSHKAAIIANSEYVESGRTIDDILKEDIQNVVKNIQAESDLNPSNAAAVLNDYNDGNNKYKMAGLTLNGKKVEWISLYYNENYNAKNESEYSYKFFTLSGDVYKSEVLTATQYADKKNWPAAEGSQGAYVFKKDWNSSIQYNVADIGDQYAGASASEPETVKWIQRDKNWYVQETNSIDGINLTFDLSDENVNPEEHPLISKNDPDDKKLLGISTAKGADYNNLRTALQIYANYTDSSKVTFSHLEVTNSDGVIPTDYNIKNGFIFVKSESYARDLKWAGIYSDSYSETESERKTLQKLLDEEKQLISDFLLRKTTTLTLAYQEYYKQYDPETKTYTMVPVTCFGTISNNPGNNTENESGSETSTDPGYVVDNSDGKKTTYDSAKGEFQVPVKVELSVNGSDTDTITIPSVVKIPLLSKNQEKPAAGDVVYKGQTVAKIELDESASNYEVEYAPKASAELFSVEDLKVYKKVVYKITDVSGNKIGEYVNEKDEIKHAGNASQGELSFYLGDYNKGYSTEEEQIAVDKINSGNNIHSCLFLQNSGHTFELWTPIATVNSNFVSFKWSYDKDAADTAFDIDKVNIQYSYTVNLNGGSFNNHQVEGNYQGKVTFKLKHKTDSDTDGYYLSETPGIEWNKDTDTALCSSINYRAEQAYINLKVGSRVANQVCKIENTLYGVDAEYANSAGSSFSYDRITASAKYSIGFTNLSVVSDDAVTSVTINHSLPLEHHSNPGTDTNLVYYMASGNNSSLQGDNQDESVMSAVKTGEAPVLSTLNQTLENEKYKVVYCDKKTKWADITVDTVAGFTPPSVVYLPYDDGKSDVTNPAKVIAYLGSSNDVTIKSSYSGCWSLSEPDGSIPYVKVSSGSTYTYYYINDGITYNIKRIGSNSPSDSPANATNDVKFYNIPAENGISAVRSLTIENGVKEIGSYAFADLKMTENGSVTIPQSVETIGISAFESCGDTGAGTSNFTSLTLVTGDSNSSSGLQSIGAKAFKNCFGLTATRSFEVPSTVTEIGSEAFANFKMPNGTFTVNGVSGTEQTAPASQGKPANKGNAVKAAELSPAGIISGNVFDYSGDTTKKFTVNKLVVGGNVEKIADNAFKNTDFSGADSSVEITGNVTTVGAEAFKGTNFKASLIFDTNVRYIERSAFEGCADFAGSVNLNQITEIKGNAFKGLASVTCTNLNVPNTVTRLDEGAFDGFASGNEVSADYPSLTVNGCTSGSLGAGIFTNAHFRNVTIGGNVTEISARAFKNSPLNNVTPYNYLNGDLIIGSSVKTIGSSAFEGCAGFEGTLTLGTGLEEIGDAAFNGCCRMTGGLTVPSGVKTIDSRAFMGCVGFNGTLTLNSGLEKIGMEAFKNCTNFKGGLTVPSGITGGIGNCAFQGFANKVSDADSGVLYLYSGSTSAGKEIGAFIFTEAKFNGMVIGGTVEKIGVSAFHQGSSMSEGVKADYSQITGELIVERSVTDIDDCAFYDCSSLTGTPMFNAYKVQGSDKYSLSDSAGVTHFGEGAFRGCTGFSGELFIPKTVTNIEKCAFKMYGNGNCSLKIYGGSNGTVLGALVSGETYHPIFPSSKFTNVTIGGNVTEVTAQFLNNNLLNFLIENAKVTGEDFGEDKQKTYDYSKISGILTIESSVTRIGEVAFKEMNFTEIRGNSQSGSEALGRVTYVGKEAFDGCTNMSGRINLSSVVTLENSAFRDCEKLNGSSAAGDLTLSSVKKIGAEAFKNCKGFTGKLFLNGSSNEFEKIGESSFSGCTGFSGGLTIPENIKIIDVYAFTDFGSNCDDSSAGELKILGSTSEANNGLERKIDQHRFSGSKFVNIYIGGAVTDITNQAFNNSKKNDDGTMNYEKPSANSDYRRVSGSLTIANTVKTIGSRAFCNVPFTGSVTLGSGITTIGTNAFDHCTKVSYGANQGLTIGANVTSIGQKAFYYFAAESSSPGKLTINGYSKNDDNHTLAYGIFSFANFEDVEIGGSVKTIDNFAFYNYVYENTDSYKKTKNDDGTVFSVTFDGSGNNASGYTLNYETANYYNLNGTLTIGKNVEKIGHRAFGQCRFTNIIFEADTVPVEIKCESGVEFRSTKYTSSLKTIEQDAFNMCDLVTEDLIIPENVTYIGKCAFKKFGTGSGALYVYGISENDDNKTLGAYNKPIFNMAKFKNVTIGGSVRTIYESFMNNNPAQDNMNYSGITGNLTIEPYVNKIGDYAFQNTVFDGNIEFCYLTVGSGAATAPLEGVMQIGKYAFNGCSKFSGGLKIPCTVSSIGENAFVEFASGSENPGALIIDGYSTGTKKLTSTQFVYQNSGQEHSCQMIEAGIFNKAQFKNVEIGWMTQAIEDGFMKTDLDNGMDYRNISGNLSIGANVIYIGDGAFSAETTKDGKFTGSLSFLYGMNSKRVIGERAFMYQNFTGDLVLPYTIGTIKKEAFAICEGFDGKLEFNYSPNGPVGTGVGIDTIGIAAFSGCSGFYTDSEVKSLTIPDSVVSLGENAFYKFGYENTNSNNYPSLTILGGTTVSGTVSLNEKIFSYAKFRNITIGGNVQKIADKFMDNYDKDNFYKAESDPENSGSGYMNTTPVQKEMYSEIKGSLCIGKSVTVIGQKAFWDCTGLDGVIKFNDESLPNPQSRNGVVTINGDAFSGCVNLYSYSQLSGAEKNLTIPDTVTTIGAYAFKNVSHNLTDSADFPSLTILGTSCTDSNGRRTIGNGTEPIFPCSKFRNITIGGNVKVVGTKLFFNMKVDGTDNQIDYTGLYGDVVIQDNVEAVNELAFAKCINLSGLTIGSKVTSMGQSAFKSYGNGSGALEIYGCTDSAGNLGDGTTTYFSYAKFKDVIIGGSVRKISAHFMHHKLDYIVSDGESTTVESDYSNITGKLIIENCVTEIGDYAFEGDTGFNGRLLFENTEKTKEEAKKNEIPATSCSLNKIGKQAFNNCTNFSGDLYLPYREGSYTIGDAAFHNFASATSNPGQLETWTGTDFDDNGNSVLNGEPFEGAQFNGMNIHGSVNSIADNAFDNTNGKFNNIKGSLTIHGPTSIGEQSFMSCKFNGSLVLGDKVKTITKEAFKNCTDFYSEYTAKDKEGKVVQAVFTIPSSVTEIGENAFESMCSGITEANFSKVPKLEILGASLVLYSNNNVTDSAFGSTNVYDSTNKKYNTITIFKKAKFNNVYIGGNVKSIAENAFDNTDGIYNNITGDFEIAAENVWKKSFYKINSSSNKGTHRGKLILDNTVKKIGDQAFADTKFFGDVDFSERHLTIPSSVIEMRTGAFQNFCSGFTYAPPSLLIEGCSTMNAASLNKSGFGENEGYAIFNGSYFKNVTITGNVKIIAKNSFKNNSGNLNNWTGTLTLKSTIEGLYDGAFDGHNFSEIKVSSSIKHKGQGINVSEWSWVDKRDIFGSADKVSVGTY